MNKIVLIALCAGALPISASKPAPSLQNQFVAFFITQDLDKAKGVYKDMPDFQKIDALQAVFDVSDPSTMDRKFQESLARFLTNPINVDHNTYWKQLSVPTRWQEWIGKHHGLKKVAKPLSSSKKVRPAAPSYDRPSTPASTASMPVSSAAADIKGGAAAAAARAPIKQPTPAPRAIVVEHPTGQATVKSLAVLIRAEWPTLDDEAKVEVVEQFKRLSSSMQHDLMRQLKDMSANQGAIKTLERYLAEPMPAEGPEIRSLIDSLLERGAPKNLQAVIGILQGLISTDVDLLYGLVQITTKKFKLLSEAQKGQIERLVADTPAEYHEALFREWEKVDPALRKYFEPAIQKFINARQAEGR